jgi:hypothetical protein
MSMKKDGIKLEANKMKEVHIRGGFSDRNGIAKENETIQIDSFDIRTRTAMYNLLNEAWHDYSKIMLDNDYTATSKCQTVIKRLLSEAYQQNVDWDVRIGYDIDGVFSNCIKPTIMEGTYDATLSLIEYLCPKINDFLFDCRRLYSNLKPELIYIAFNQLFEREYVGYRFVSEKIVPITDENEIAAVEEAINRNPHQKVAAYISNAVKELANRGNPDYAKVIKESISAVEAMCQILVKKASTLGEALKRLKDNGIGIHPALEEAFSKLYGYTSNENGIRHANINDDGTQAFEEAKFMLVTCSAFVNYLIGKQAKIEAGGN